MSEATRSVSHVPTLSKQLQTASDSDDAAEKHSLEAEHQRSTAEDYPWRWKVTALCLGIFLSVGSSFSETTLGPLKATLIRELKISNARYGALSSATSLVNTVLPFVGGAALDFYGVEWGSMVCSVAIFIGAVVSAAGSNIDSFGCILGGRIIMGIGSSIIETCTSKILAHWFKRRGLGLVYGFDIAFGRCVTLAARAAAVPMRDATSFWGWALWIPAIMCFVNLLQNIAYVWWVRSLPSWTRIPTGRERARQAVLAGAGAQGDQSENKDAAPRFPALPKLKTFLRVPTFFWIVVVTQVLQAGTVGGFNGLSADIIRHTRGTTEQTAGYTSSLQSVIPIVLTPVLGAFFDFVGFRMVFVSVVAAIWITTYALMGYTQVNALGVMILSSFGLAFNALPFIASIPLMAPAQTELGLVFGVWKSFNNCGSVIVDMAAGRIQDVTPGNRYGRVIAFFIGMKALQFCLGIFYSILDVKYLNGVLKLSETKRKRLEQENLLQHGDLKGQKPAFVTNLVGLAVMGSMIVTAWALFIRYTL